MNQLQSLIGTVINSAVDRAAQGASQGDLAQGLLAGLKRLRAVVNMQAGYGAACGLDDTIHELLIQRALELQGANSIDTPPLSLPPKGSGAWRAAAILEDTAMSCLSLNAFFPGNAALSLAVRIMATRLVDHLGGLPKWSEVIHELRTQETNNFDDPTDSDQWTPLAVH